jgi:hypothetical protein
MLGAKPVAVRTEGADYGYAVRVGRPWPHDPLPGTLGKPFLERFTAA